MALGIVVTKDSVELRRPGTYYVNIRMIVTDDATEVINKVYQINYSTGQDPEFLIKNLQGTMQDDIDKYIAEQVVYNHVKLDNAVTYLNSNLTGGE